MPDSIETSYECVETIYEAMEISQMLQENKKKNIRNAECQNFISYFTR